MPSPAHAAAKKAVKKVVKKAPVSTVMDRHWQKTFELMKDKDPVAAKLLTWIYVTQTNLPVETRDLMRFVVENPGWPRLGDFRDKIEEEIGGARLDAHEVAEWFRRHPPRTYAGFKAQMGALGAAEEARAAARAFWRGAQLDKNETAGAVSRFGAYLSPQDHAARLDNLIWKGRHAEAEYMLAFVTPGARALGQARIALARLSKKAPEMVEAVPPALKEDEGLVFERVRWYRRKNNDEKALALMNAMRAPVRHPEAWWGERNILARRAMEKLDFRHAREIIARHGLSEGVDYAQAEWMLGWLDLRFLNAPEGAYRRFGELYGRVQSAISRSRAAYWAARAAEALRLPEQAAEWDRVAAAYGSTFYGQLSMQRLGAVPAGGAGPSPEAARAFGARELVHAVRMLKKTGLEQCMDPFLAKIVSGARTREEFQLAARLSREVGRDYYAVQANKDIQQRLGDYMLDEGYPLLPAAPYDRPEKALVHAIVYRESMFDAKAVSAADARGLMQLMPATAKAVSKQKKTRYAKDRLTADPQYNVRIGAAYLASLLDDYKGRAPLAIAAYNAGPGNVSKWLKTFGDPSERRWVDWIELIPNHETRNYVQRVMETWHMYRVKLGQKPVTVRDFGG